MLCWPPALSPGPNPPLSLLYSRPARAVCSAGLLPSPPAQTLLCPSCTHVQHVRYALLASCPLPRPKPSSVPRTCTHVQHVRYALLASCPLPRSKPSSVPPVLTSSTCGMLCWPPALAPDPNPPQSLLYSRPARVVCSAGLPPSPPAQTLLSPSCTHVQHVRYALLASCPRPRPKPSSVPPVLTSSTCGMLCWPPALSPGPNPPQSLLYSRPARAVCSAGLPPSPPAQTLLSPSCTHVQHVRYALLASCPLPRPKPSSVPPVLTSSTCGMLCWPWNVMNHIGSFSNSSAACETQQVIIDNQFVHLYTS